MNNISLYKSIASEEWFYQKYVIDRLSSIKIAKILKCSQKVVRKALIYNKIKFRTRKEAYVSRKGSFSKKELKDRDWLYQKYIIEKHNQNEIASILNCTNWSINAALKFHNIPIRSHSECIKIRHSKDLNRSKYPLLNDKSWLYQKAVKEQLTYQEMATLAGAKHFQSVCQALKKFNLLQRRILCPRTTGESSYLILNDKSWLKNKYIKEKLSTIEIAEIVGCNCSNVAQSLRRQGIPVRDKSSGHIYKQNPERDGLKFNKKSLDIIIGGLLGDGYLIYNNNGNASYGKTSIYKEYLEFEGKQLFGTKCNERISLFKDNGEATFNRYTSGIKSTKTYKTKKSYKLSSLRYKEFLLMYKKWYKQVEGKNIKIIPDDLDVNKKVLLMWFMDDGYSYIVKKKKSKAQLRIYFSTEGFQYDELKKLSEKVEQQFGLHLYPRFHQRHGKHYGSGYELELSLKDVELFYKIIGPCPIKCFEYKWKLDKIKKLWKS